MIAERCAVACRRLRTHLASLSATIQGANCPASRPGGKSTSRTAVGGAAAWTSSVARRCLSVARV